MSPGEVLEEPSFLAYNDQTPWLQFAIIQLSLDIHPTISLKLALYLWEASQMVAL